MNTAVSVYEPGGTLVVSTAAPPKQCTAIGPNTRRPMMTARNEHLDCHLQVLAKRLLSARSDCLSQQNDEFLADGKTDGLEGRSVVCRDPQCTAQHSAVALGGQLH